MDGKQPRPRSGNCAIAARGDLPAPRGSAFGGIDAKVLKVTEMHKVAPMGIPGKGATIKAPLVRTSFGNCLGA
jgi:hypothetical protein